MVLKQSLVRKQGARSGLRGARESRAHSLSRALGSAVSHCCSAQPNVV